MNSYGVYPFEPTLFNTTFQINVKDQIPQINSVDTKFAGFTIDKMDANFSEKMDFLKAVKQNSSVILRVKDLNKYDISQNLLLSLSMNNNSFSSIEQLMNSKNNYSMFELRDLPKDLKKIDAFLGKMNNPNIILHTNTDLKTISSTVFSVKPYAIGFDQYGVCVDYKAKLNNLYNYFIDKDVMIKNTEKVKLIISETDAICSDKDGITNTFGSCLWLLDFLFQTAQGNIKNLFPKYNNANYYALLAFSYATRNNAVFYDSSENYGVQVRPNISLYVTKNIKEYHIVVIHKDITQENIQIQVKLPVSGPGRLIRLVSNQTDIGTKGITFGEYTFDNGKLKDVGMNHSDNIVHGPIVNPQENTYSFIVTRLSASILTVPIELMGGAFFDNINDEDEANTIVTVRPDSREPDSVPLTMSVKTFEKSYTD